MQIHWLQLLLICVFGGIAWYVNNSSENPYKSAINMIIFIGGILLILASLFGHLGGVSVPAISVSP